MDCNRFSGPTCPLKFHDARAKVGRLYISRLLIPIDTQPSIFSPAHLCPFAGRTRVSTRTFIPAAVFARRLALPALCLATCIPRIIRILQLLHRTILTNKRHVVITSRPPISFLLQSSLWFLLPVRFPRWRMQLSARTIVPNSTFVDEIDLYLHSEEC